MDEPISSAEQYPARYWHHLDDGRIQCDLCPRDCKLHDGQRGACFVRGRVGATMVLTTYGRSSGFCVDPIEKKPLNQFYPGSSVLSFGTAGCNLACKFCQTGTFPNHVVSTSLLIKPARKRLRGVPGNWGARVSLLLTMTPLSLLNMQWM